MNTKSKSHKAEFVAGCIAKPNTINPRMAAAGRGLRREAKTAFDLAESAGRELNAAFALGGS